MDNLLSTNFAMAAACSLFLAPSVMLYNSTLAQGSDDPPCVIIWPGWTLTVTYDSGFPSWFAKKADACCRKSPGTLSFGKLVYTAKVGAVMVGDVNNLFTKFTKR